MHGAEFKAQVMTECQQPGASVATVAMAHGLKLTSCANGWSVSGEPQAGPA
ncbi:MAG: hypothetical protein MZW92_81160 [Comamonadaceae bacterium]|nr:hypothetical protein [Comamonadaceae bacterium]